jgi:hypothetical protein
MTKLIDVLVTYLVNRRFDSQSYDYLNKKKNYIDS